jgi:hypothetical protein
VRERRVEKKRMIKWLGENGGELVGTNKCKKKDLCVQISFSFVGFVRDALVEAQECYVGTEIYECCSLPLH